MTSKGCCRQICLQKHHQVYVTNITVALVMDQQSFLWLLSLQSMSDPKDNLSKNMQSQSRQERYQQYRLLKSQIEILVENWLNF